MSLFPRSLRALTLVTTAVCVLLTAGCTGPKKPPTATQLLASAADGQGDGLPCAVNGDVLVNKDAAQYDSVSSVSIGDTFSATVTAHYGGANPFSVPVQYVDDGATLYVRSPAQMKLSYNGKVPAAVAGHWIGFPSWPAVSTQEYNTEFSKVSHTPGRGGQFLTEMAMRSSFEIYMGASCKLLLARLQPNVHGVDDNSPVQHATLDGQPVLTFIVHSPFAVAVDPLQTLVTVSTQKPTRLLRVSIGSDVLSLTYPATIPAINAPPAAQVISADSSAWAAGDLCTACNRAVGAG
jgi:hypothetical protein